VTAIAALLLLAAPAFDAFEAPLSAERWYVGTGARPKGGKLKLSKGAWLASRGIADDGLQRLELRFRHKGGALELSFHGAQEPLTRPTTDPLVIQPKKGDRVLVVSSVLGVRLDGEPLDWKPKVTGTFRICGRKGGVELHAVTVAPAPTAAPAPSRLERDTLFLLTAPQLYRDGTVTCQRATLGLWDVETAFLFRRGASSVVPLRGPGRGAPTLGHIVRVSDGKQTAASAASHPLAMTDWSDERGNLGASAYRLYLAREYALFELLMDAQRVMLEALPEKSRRVLEPLVALAAIRHADNSRAALALAETLGMKKAVKLVQAELGGRAGRRPSSDKVRAAAASAARKLLGGRPPAEWRGFAFDPHGRIAMLQQARELLR